MTTKRTLVALLLALAALSFVAGCAERSRGLLAADYTKMSNDDLQRYYDRLNDEIDREEIPPGPGFGIGIGMGMFEHGVGGELGAGTTGPRYVARDLRMRRSDVRRELESRGLTP